MFDVVRVGTIVQIPLDAADALISRTSDAARRVYEAKRRDYGKPMELVGGQPTHEMLHMLDDERRAVVRVATKSCVR